MLIRIAASAAIAGSVYAGQPIVSSKTVAPPEELYGVGWYGALEGGVNAYQDLGERRNCRIRLRRPAHSLVQNRGPAGRALRRRLVRRTRGRRECLSGSRRAPQLPDPFTPASP